MRPGDERIQFIGFRPDTAQLFCQASVYFQPSEFESFGLAVCEAMMFGLPCVVSNCGGLAELVQNGKSGFVVEGWSEDPLAQKLTELISDDRKRNEMGRFSRKRYLESFTEERWLSGFSEIVKDMMCQ